MQDSASNTRSTQTQREREREREEPEVGGEGHQAAQGAEKNLSVFKVLFTEQ